MKVQLITAGYTEALACLKTGQVGTMKKILCLVIICWFWSTSASCELLDVELMHSFSTPVAVRAMVASADGQIIYLLLDDGTVQLRTADGQLRGSFDAGPGVSDIAVLGTNRLLLKNQYDQQLLIIQINPEVHISTQDSPTLGLPSAPVTIAVFDDFQCPYCSRAVGMLKALVERYPEQAKLVFKNFPLSMHKHARFAAIAGLAAQRQGKFWALHDLMFANYRQLNPALIRQLATTLNLNMERFEEDLKDPALGRCIDSDIQEGKSIGVRGTPTIFINGRRVQKRSLEEMSHMIDEELVKLQAGRS